MTTPTELVPASPAVPVTRPVPVEVVLTGVPNVLLCPICEDPHCVMSR